MVMEVIKFLLPKWGVAILLMPTFCKFGIHPLPKKMIAPYKIELCLQHEVGMRFQVSRKDSVCTDSVGPYSLLWTEAGAQLW